MLMFCSRGTNSQPTGLLLDVTLLTQSNVYSHLTARACSLEVARETSNRDLAEAVVEDVLSMTRALHPGLERVVEPT